MIPIFTGNILKGKLVLQDKERFEQYVSQLKDCKINLTIKEQKNERSINQNNLYWAYLNLIEKETGNSANDLHNYFKQTRLKPHFKEVFGKNIETRKSTTKLTTKEFTDYLKAIEHETGIPIPDWSLVEI